MSKSSKKSAPPQPRKAAGKRPEKMLEWLSLHWSAVDAATGGLTLLLSPRRELFQAWAMMSAAVAVGLGLALFAELWLVELVPEVYRRATWFHLVAMPTALVLVAAPPLAIVMLWLCGRAIARERKADTSPLASRFFAALWRLAVLSLPVLLAAAIGGYGLVLLATYLGLSTQVPGLVQSLGWAAALALGAGWAAPRIMYLPCRLADGRDATLGETRAKVRTLSRLAYGRHVLLALLFLLLLSMVYVFVYGFYAGSPSFFVTAPGRLTMTLLAAVPAGFVLAHATTTLAWTYSRLTLRDTISDKNLAAMTDATATLAGLGRPDNNSNTEREP